MRYREGIRDDPPIHNVQVEMQHILKERFKAAAWDIPEDFLSFAQFVRCIDDIDMSCSPGYPLITQFPNNGSLFGVTPGQRDYNPVRLQMVWEMVQQRLRDKDADPIRVFIKPEPITKKKLAAGRNRIISSISIVDRIIDAMLFEPMNKVLHEKHAFIPSKVGWSPYVGGWKVIPKWWWATDKSAWDWTATMWLAQEALNLRKSLCRTTGEKFRIWCEMAEWRYRKLYVDVIYISSGGLLFKAKFNGVVKSGSVNTIDDNSIMQDILHVRTCLETNQEITDQMVLGDDILQEPPKDPDSYYDHLGQFCSLKQVLKRAEFAGNYFNGMIVDPLYYGKHCYNLLHVEDSIRKEVASSYALFYLRSPKSQEIRKICEELGEVSSDDLMSITFDGE